MPVVHVTAICLNPWNFLKCFTKKRFPTPVYPPIYILCPSSIKLHASFCSSFKSSMLLPHEEWRQVNDQQGVIY